MSVEKNIEYIQEAQAVVNEHERLELAAYQLAILLSHDQDPVVLDPVQIASGGQVVRMQRLIPLEHRLEEEKQIREDYQELEQDLLDDREREFLPAARTIVGLIFAEAYDNARERSRRIATWTSRYADRRAR